MSDLIARVKAFSTRVSELKYQLKNSQGKIPKHYRKKIVVAYQLATLGSLSTLYFTYSYLRAVEKLPPSDKKVRFTYSFAGLMLSLTLTVGAQISLLYYFKKAEQFLPKINGAVAQQQRVELQNKQ